MRVLWSANAPWCASGYGVQSKHVLPRLQALGHEIGIFAWFGLAGGCMKADLGGGPIQVYPMHRDPYGNDIVAHHARHFRADVLITLIDIWVLDPAAHKAAGIPWVAYFPVDHSPVSEIILERARACDYPTQYSRFGLAETEMAGVPCGYIPHGVSPAYTPGDKAQARRDLKLPQDAFLCSIVAANKGFPDRKGFQWQLEAFANFQRNHPEAMLYLHMIRNEAGGIPMDALIAALGIPPQSVRFVDQYAHIIGMPEEYLADIYRASDVLLGAACAEGFGIPLAEAQACGTPVITTDFSAMTELTVNGICTEPAGKFYQPLFTAWQAIPSVANITAALDEVFGWSMADRQRRSAEGVAHMQREYNWDTIVKDYWAPMLERIDAEREPRRQALYVAQYEAYAARDAVMPRSEADVWYNKHRFHVAAELWPEDLEADHTALVDLGAAEGGLEGYIEAAEYTAVDVSQSRIERGQRDRRWINWQHGDAATWGDSDTYDLAACLELIEHVPDPAALLANAYRILRPGGYLLLSTPNDPSGQNVDGQEHLRGYGPMALEQAVTAAGFEVVARESTVPGLYGADGLLRHPERLPEWQARAQAGQWSYEDGSNLFLLCRRPAVVARVEVGA